MLDVKPSKILTLACSYSFRTCFSFSVSSRWLKRNWERPHFGHQANGPSGILSKCLFKVFSQSHQQNCETGSVDASYSGTTSPFSPFPLGSSPTGRDSRPLMSPFVSFGWHLSIVVELWLSCLLTHGFELTCSSHSVLRTSFCYPLTFCPHTRVSHLQEQLNLVPGESES